jgi:hypothetical protein
LCSTSRTRASKRVSLAVPMRSACTGVRGCVGVWVCGVGWGGVGWGGGCGMHWTQSASEEIWMEGTHAVDAEWCCCGRCLAGLMAHTRYSEQTQT